ncbi:MAG: KH domain-containing protein [Candidatus Levybacteria bacterium]|nr:KH domain-containing protein [Candidatus Levybacteria bacterium]
MNNELTPITAEDITIITATAEELIKTLELQAEVEVVSHETTAEVILKTEESGIIIGYHGEVLEAFQLLLSLMVSRKAGHFMRLSVEVGDYKKNRSEYLESLAQQTKEKVLEEGRPHTLSSLKSWERRVVHMILQDDQDVISESMGEGKDRVLVIKPRE